jgi:hypothetical protein
MSLNRRRKYRPDRAPWVLDAVLTVSWGALIPGMLWLGGVAGF